MEAEIALEEYEKKMLLVGDVSQELQERLQPGDEDCANFVTETLEKIEDR